MLTVILLVLRRLDACRAGAALDGDAGASASVETQPIAEAVILVAADDV